MEQEYCADMARNEKKKTATQTMYEQSFVRAFLAKRAATTAAKAAKVDEGEKTIRLALNCEIMGKKNQRTHTGHVCSDV